mmetsp:Transcript_5546/g.10849  ORF Transcript_5546/g.10849 Transcript_5546/m.10849 type:complete len:231 (+) Transcript_5546:408-1100(+)
MIGGADYELLINGLAFSQCVGNEHDWLFVQWKFIDTKPSSLHPKVVLVFYVDRPVWRFCNFDVVRSAFQTIFPELFFDDRSVRVQDCMHVARVRMVIVSVYWRRKNGVGQPTALFVNVSHGIGRTGEYNTIDIHGIVEFVMDAFLSIGQDLHLSDTCILAEINIFRKFLKDLTNALSSIFPRLACGNIAIILASSRTERSGIVLCRMQRNLCLNHRTEDRWEGPQFVDQK